MTNSRAGNDLPASLRQELDLATDLDVCEQLLSHDDLPEPVVTSTRQRMADLAPQLMSLTESANWARLPVPLPEGWRPVAQSFAASEAGFCGIVCAMNGDTRSGQRTRDTDADGSTRYDLYWIELGANFTLQRVARIDDHLLRAEPAPSSASGLTAPQLVRFGDGWWVAATARDRDAHGTPYAVVSPVQDDQISRGWVFAQAGAGAQSWQPVSDASAPGLLFATQLRPVMVVGVNPSSGASWLHGSSDGLVVGRHWRLVTQLVRNDERWLAIAMEEIDMPDGGGRAVHRWLELDDGWNITRHSRPFVVDTSGHERVCTLAVRDGLAVLGVVRNAELGHVVVDVDQVRALLRAPLALDARQAGTRPRSMTGGSASDPRPVAAEKPYLVSTTLSGNSQETIADALRSVVNVVDACVVIDTGITDDTLAVARGVAGDKLVVRQFTWCNDFSAARNFALQAATELGATWAMTLDTDERMHFGDTDIRAVLLATREPALLAVFDAGVYTKDRFLRLPARGGFRGPTHEAFYYAGLEHGARLQAPGVSFSELPKTPETLQRKFERDADVLTAYVAEHASEPRWFYYLGDSLRNLERYDDAIDAYYQCSDLRGWDEEGAWAMFRAAECYAAMDLLEEAVESCALGMARHAGIPELPWFASYLSWRLGRMEQAVYWARLALVHGRHAGDGAEIPRNGWSFPPGCWEGPYDVLRYALPRLGKHDEAAAAERAFHAAAAARQSWLEAMQVN